MCELLSNYRTKTYKVLEHYNCIFYVDAVTVDMESVIFYLYEKYNGVKVELGQTAFININEEQAITNFFDTFNSGFYMYAVYDYIEKYIVNKWH